MSEDSQSQSPDEPNSFRFVEVGMQLTYEFELLGQIKTSLGHTIEFRPVFSSRGWSTHKEFVASLRLIHFTVEGREVGRCLVDRDEVAAWSRLLRMMQESSDCSDGLLARSLEYATRNGVCMVWNAGFNAPFLLHVSSPQPAILPEGFVSQLLNTFDDFERLCQKYA